MQRRAGTTAMEHIITGDREGREEGKGGNQNFKTQTKCT